MHPINPSLKMLHKTCPSPHSTPWASKTPLAALVMGPWRHKNSHTSLDWAIHFHTPPNSSTPFGLWQMEVRDCLVFPWETDTEFKPKGVVWHPSIKHNKMDNLSTWKHPQVTVWSHGSSWAETEISTQDKKEWRPRELETHRADPNTNNGKRKYNPNPEYWWNGSSGTPLIPLTYMRAVGHLSSTSSPVVWWPPWLSEGHEMGGIASEMHQTLNLSSRYSPSSGHKTCHRGKKRMKKPPWRDPINPPYSFIQLSQL